MTPTANTATLIVLIVLAGLGSIVAFRSGARGAYKVARQTEQVTRMGGNLTRALGTGAVIVAIQWAVVALSTDPRAWGWPWAYQRCSPGPRSPGCSRSPN
jgi:type II secretory pathway pseudopilin PulG